MNPSQPQQIDATPEPVKKANRQSQLQVSNDRKPYNRPQLEIYGELSEITKAATDRGNLDGGSDPVFHHTLG